jgi:SOS-response transcriptional repressor LexA
MAERAWRFDAAEAQRENRIGAALAQARRDRGLTLAQLCEALEHAGLKTNRASVNKWEKGEYIPNAYQLLAVCQALGIRDLMAQLGGSEPELDRRGMEKLEEYRRDLIASGRYTPPRPMAAITYLSMPVSLLPVSAGTGAFLDEGNFEMRSFPEEEVPQGADFALLVRGDSMEPRYHDGQLVWVQQCETVRPGEVGIFLYDGSGYMKQYGEERQKGEGQPRPLLISFNRAYAPIPVSPELEFRVAGRVLN